VPLLARLGLLLLRPQNIPPHALAPNNHWPKLRGFELELHQTRNGHTFSRAQIICRPTTLDGQFTFYGPLFASFSLSLKLSLSLCLSPHSSRAAMLLLSITSQLGGQSGGACKSFAKLGPRNFCKQNPLFLSNRPPAKRQLDLPDFDFNFYFLWPLLCLAPPIFGPDLPSTSASASLKLFLFLGRLFSPGLAPHRHRVRHTCRSTGTE